MGYGFDLSESSRQRVQVSHAITVECTVINHHPYTIPYCRTRAWPSGSLAELHYNYIIGVIHNNVLKAYTSSKYFKFEVYT